MDAVTRSNAAARATGMARVVTSAAQQTPQQGDHSHSRSFRGFSYCVHCPSVYLLY